MTYVVSCEGVSKTFVRKSNSVQALSDVSLNLGVGEFVAIRGKSGCGKSTLMLCLGGLQRPDQGSVQIVGQSLYSMSPDERAAFRARHIGYVFQQFHLIPYLSVVENVLSAELGLKSTEQAEASWDRATELIRQVDLADRMDHKPSELSIGECQRVAVARALMNGPQLILADEPTGNLDDENTDRILTSMRQIADNGTSVLLVTHDSKCEQFVDRVINMKLGRIL